MSGEKDIEQLKKEAAEKAKAAAAAKAKAAAEGSQAVTASEPLAQADGDEKAKAAAVAKAKAAAAAKAKAAAQAKENTEETIAPATDDEKAKAIAAAKAKAAAAAKAKAAAGAGAKATDDEKAKAIAAAKAKAAAAAKAKQAGAGDTSSADDKAKAVAAAKAAAVAKAKAAGANATVATPAAVEEAKPSPNQQFLDKYVRVIEEHLGTEVLDQSYINNLSNDVPTLVAKRDTYFKVAQFLKYNEQLGFDYLSELHGTDFETHMEVYAHFYSYKNRQSVALKVKIDRNTPELESIVPLWPGADWAECEAYDLLGIKFLGHPHLHRMLLGDDWIGHPLRKDYEQYDVEV